MGLKSYDIAQQLNVSPGQITNDLKAVFKEWRQSRISDIEEIKARELSKLDLIERHHWQAYIRSCDKINSQKVKKAMDKKGNYQEYEREVRALQGIGNPVYLDGVLKCIERRSKIIGYESQKVSLSFDQLNDQQLDQLMDKLLNNEQ